ncbi:hypothetical protein JTE90_021535 [Oedothorax gibbosus]|uniref:Poly [ADP-ribose] polymerase n=1 Tax=Oedothorax gibbosus TaxID=931172 RepID=A0AAV6VS37_9ARAC|nr:hypothetical protein JTE90_021535 [Oedothorax gibbosus]
MSGDKMCSFIWQHQYHKNWVTYSEKESELLNKAARRWQKTVSLPSKDDKKKIIVYLDEMYQINQVSSISQPIRCLVYSDNFYSWLWKDDNDNWCSYRPTIVFFLEVAYQRKECIFRFYEQDDYFINLETFVQMNEHTNYTRSVLREKVDLILTVKRLNCALKNEQLKKMCSDEAVDFRKSCINLPSLSASICGTSSEIKLCDIPDGSFISVEEETELYFCSLPTDSMFPDRRDFHIYCEGGLAFSAILNLSCADYNHNKFCIIQLLKHNSKEEYGLWKRSGRVGTRGRMKIKSYKSDITEAKRNFEVTFYEKTKNRWENKNSFLQCPDKFDLLDIDQFPDTETNELAVDLDPSIESLLALICDKKTMAKFMKEMLFDPNLPLGKLTLKQIKQGYVALNKIAHAIACDDMGSALVKACSEFYTKIPHAFENKCPPLIRTKEDIQTKLTMLETLTNIRIATKSMNSEPEIIMHPLNKYYNSLKYELEPLKPYCNEYAAIEIFLKSTHGPTHMYQLDVVDIFKCHPKKQFSFNDIKNKILLWHGSRITNWAGILSRGLCIAPLEAPHTGCMFGKGLYFADVSSKSANYCHATRWDRKGLLLICEVSVGNQLQLTESDESLPKSLPACYDSVLGKGKIIPKNFQFGVLSSDAKEPIGELVEDSSTETCLNYNEYVVYDSELVKMKYLLRVEFKF